jgi:dihydrofolate reductase
MRRLVVFNSVSVDGYFTDANGDMRFAHNTRPDEEWDAFVAGNASAGGVLVFGRITYEMMAGFWTTPLAAQRLPDVAERMNALPKIVFSRTLQTATWHNTTLLRGDPADEIARIKAEPGDDMAILGSGSIVSQLAHHDLIDEFQVVVTPVALGAGRTMFEGMGRTLPLTLARTRVFANGNVVLCYKPRA